RGRSNAWRFVQAALDQRAERRHGRLLVWSIRRDRDFAAFRGSKQEQSHDAFPVNFAAAAADLDAARETARRVHESRGGAGVKPKGIEYGDDTPCHAFSPFSRSEATQMAFRPCSRMSRASDARSS